MTVQALGRAGLENGQVLRRAQGRIDAFVTMDANLEFQQRLAGLPFGTVTVHAPSNRVADLLPLMPVLGAALEGLGAGIIRHVGAWRFSAAPESQTRFAWAGGQGGVRTIPRRTKP